MSPSAPPRVTQRDLARLAKVSHTTVSLALRNHPSIPAQTRARITRLARKHRYQPDPMLDALNAYRVSRTPARFQGTIAWLTNFETAGAWRGMIQAEGYFLGAQEQAQRLGYKPAACAGSSSRRCPCLTASSPSRGIGFPPSRSGTRLPVPSCTW